MKKPLAACALSLLLLSPGEARRFGSGRRGPGFTRRFLFWTNAGEGSPVRGTYYYNENYKHTMVVTTPFPHWTCFRTDVTLGAHGHWYGGFTCVANDDSGMGTSVSVDCSPNVATPMVAQSMGVVDKVNGKDVMVKFNAACSTGTEVPLRGEVTR